jgi:hypothetical protein
VVVSDVFIVSVVVAMPSCRGAGPCQARASHILIAKFATRRGVVAGQRDKSSRQGDIVPE